MKQVVRTEPGSLVHLQVDVLPSAVSSPEDESESESLAAGC